VIRRAIAAGVPVVSLNSGSDVFRRLGVLAHVGQPEERAGEAAGRRMARGGIRRALCVNHEQGNQGLEERCRGFARALRAAGGTSRVIGVETENRLGTRRRLVAAMDGGDVDGVLTLSSSAAVAALEAIDTARRVRTTKLATFDLSPEVLEALESGRVQFTVDQQAYLQGYLPVLLLAQRARYGLFPAQGEIVPTGPSFVTKENAAQALRLSRRGIR
jgi:simple sugar transport system substrate-binding protein